MSADQPTKPTAAASPASPHTAPAPGKLQVSAGFDSGNIEVVTADDPNDIRLGIRADSQSPHYQWFHFRLAGAKDRDVVLRLTNAGGAAYTAGFKDYQAVASSDLETWRRVSTEFDGKVLTIRDRPQSDAVRYAYFAPYPLERHHRLIARTQQVPRTTLEVLGHTPDGQDIDLLRLGEPGAGKRAIWLIGRQHPGETMASWWMEGAIDHLLARPRVLDRAVIYLVPCMNPDGARRGHLRTNALGVDLNRAWAEPDAVKAPEVFLVRERMRQAGVDFCLDVHGDETLPYNFVSGFEGIPSITERQLGLLNGYTAALARRTPDFQTEKGYPKSAGGKANLAMCTNWTAETFGALSMTLEMPFKDATGTPDPEFGWSPPRCKSLAVACLDVLESMLRDLR
jgi:murein tripeptide amidase MpaA